MSAHAGRFSLRGRTANLRLSPGITAIIVKELRGRMRGRRAFIVLTLYILLLAVFAWMFQRINEQAIAGYSPYGGQATFASAAVGRGVFLGLLMLQTLMVAVLAPAATAGAISSEREHQTLELLAVTPISSLAIVLGKLISALAWVFVLILASIPVTALVFVFGGVSPDDVLRGYLVLLATAIGLGSVGIFYSALTRRTGASTGLTFITMLALVIGSLFAYVFLASTAETSPTGLRKSPSETILYLNPFVAQADVACGTEDGGYGGTCGFLSAILGPVDQFNTGGGLGPPPAIRGGPAPAFQGGGQIDGLDSRPVGGAVGDGDVTTFADTAASFRDRFWPKTVMSFLVLAAVLTTLSIQFVTPTRRWRPSLPGPVRRLNRRSRAP